jgi:hypothetical protein
MHLVWTTVELVKPPPLVNSSSAGQLLLSWSTSPRLVNFSSVGHLLFNWSADQLINCSTSQLLLDWSTSPRMLHLSSGDPLLNWSTPQLVNSLTGQLLNSYWVLKCIRRLYRYLNKFETVHTEITRIVSRPRISPEGHDCKCASMWVCKISTL